MKLVKVADKTETLVEETDTNALNLATTAGCMVCYVSKTRVRIPNPSKKEWGTLIFIPELNPVQVKMTRADYRPSNQKVKTDD